MPNAQPTILAIGASGRFAGLVVPELARRNVCVRAFLRDPGKADAVRARGATEVAIGDLRDMDSLNAALKGVDDVFYIGPAFAEDETALGLRVVEAAERAGARRFAYSSVMHPAVPLSHHAAKLPVEAALQGSRLAYTVLQPAVFFQNLDATWPQVLKRGQFSLPYSRKVPIGFVDYRDVAEVGAIALTDDLLAYGTFELCAERALDRIAIAVMMSEETGRSIEAAEQTPGEWAETTTFTGTDREKDLLARMFAYYDARGFKGNSLALTTILGREPRRFRDYIRELVARGSGTGMPALHRE
jgi:uncharacterized protein YbjT (DUF2867 family)